MRVWWEDRLVDGQMLRPMLSVSAFGVYAGIRFGRERYKSVAETGVLPSNFNWVYLLGGRISVRWMFATEDS